MIARKNIGMVYLYGSENNLINLVQGKGKQRTRNTMRVPSRYARFMNLDPGREYPVDELIQAVKAMGFNRGGEVTAESLAIMFGGGPAKSISSSDFAYYKQISDEYKKSVGDKKLDDPKRKAKAALGNGSFVTWAYFQHGVPSFTVDLWAIPTKKAAKEQEKTDPGKSKNLRRGDHGLGQRESA